MRKKIASFFAGLTAKNAAPKPDTPARQPPGIDVEVPLDLERYAGDKPVCMEHDPVATGIIRSETCETCDRVQCYICSGRHLHQLLCKVVCGITRDRKQQSAQTPQYAAILCSV